MTTSTLAIPRAVSRKDWLAARKELLAREKEVKLPPAKPVA